MVQPIATDPPLVGTEWQLTQIVEPSKTWSPPAEVESVLRLDGEGSFSARACNHFSGTVEIDGGELRPRDVIATKMGCLGPRGDVERVFGAVMSGDHAVRWAVEEGELRLDVPDGHGLRYRVKVDERAFGGMVGEATATGSVVIALDETGRELGRSYELP